MNSNRPPWLVVDALQRAHDCPTRILVDLHLGGHPLRAIFDFERPEFIEYVTVPWLLDAHNATKKAVVRLATKFDSGEQVALPVDLSQLIADSTELSAFPIPSAEGEARLHETAARVRLEVEELSRSGSYPVLFSGRLRVDGILIILRVELYDGVGRIPAMRWLWGSNPKGLSAAQHHAIQRMLVERAQIA
jgi:hypothetical protein